MRVKYEIKLGSKLLGYKQAREEELYSYGSPGLGYRGKKNYKGKVTWPKRRKQMKKKVRRE